MLVAKREESHYYEERDKRIKRKEKKNKNNKNKSNGKLKFLLFATIMLLACLFVLLRYAHITQLRLNVTKLENEKNELEKRKHESITELDRLKSAYRIEEDAKVKLGMNYPTDDQIGYVAIGNKTSDKNELNKEAKEKDEIFIVEYFKNMMDNILKKF